MIKESLLAFIISLEGFSSCAYLDLSQYSNGFGTKAANKWECISKTEAKSRMVKHLEEDSKHVLSLHPHATQNEHDALVSFCYNTGRGGCTKTVKLVAQGKKDAAGWIMRSKIKQGSGCEAGLKKRRIAEIALLNKKEKKKNFTCIYQEYS
jgi:GH24 family phage-related lysozyme (muramidase)